MEFALGVYLTNGRITLENFSFIQTLKFLSKKISKINSYDFLIDKKLNQHYFRYPSIRILKSKYPSLRDIIDYIQFLQFIKMFVFNKASRLT